MSLMNKSDKVTLVGIVMAVVILKKNKEKKKYVRKRFWCRERFLHRQSGNDLTHIAIKELQLEDSNSFKNFCRLSKKTFEDLLSVVGPLISKQNTVLRESVSATTRLLITLRYLATGNTNTDLSYVFRVSNSLISILIPQTLCAIYKSLSGKYLKGCKTAIEWKNVADQFNRKWKFPMCLGAIAGKHIAFSPKASEGSYYYNYKGFNSVILLAMVDANYKFLMVDVGTNGRSNDTAAFSGSDIGEAIKENLLNFPEDEELPNTNIKVPYVFVSDDTFPLTSRIIKPYGQEQSNENQIFNHRLSRARRVVEKAFRILASRFQVFQKEIKTPNVEKVKLITFAACTLHNYLMKEREEDFPSENVILTRLEKCTENWYSNDDSAIREKYMHYFNNVDIQDWQEESIKI